MTLPELKLPDTSVCPRCGAGLRCGNIAGDATCWCAQLPPIMPVPPAPKSFALSGKSGGGAAETGGDAPKILPSTSSPAQGETPPAASCFCPACLKQITDERLNA